MIKELAVVIPVYNENQTIKKVINDWANILSSKFFDLIIINDGSVDGTEIILKKLKRKISNLILINKKNEGHGLAICTGYYFALKNKYKYVFQTDSDDQFSSTDFKKIWSKKDSKKYDIILGNRINRDDPILRVFLSRIVLRFLLKITFKKDIIDPNIPYRLITSNFLNIFLKKIKPQKFIAPNIIMSLHAKKIFFIDVRHIKRAHGQVKWPLKKLIKFGISLLMDLNFYYNLTKKKI